MAKNYGEDLGWEIDVDFPSWGNTEIYVKTVFGDQLNGLGTS